MQGLHRRCNGEHEHQPLEGRVCLGGHWYNRTRLAQEYPDEFCKAVCRAILAQKNVCRCENGKRVDDNLEVHAVEGLKEEDDKKLCEIIRRAHQNLGHPGNDRFVEMLRAAGASQKALEHARRYKCSICEAQHGAKVQKVSKVKKTYDFNVGVCCDTFEVEVGSRKIHAFSVICEGTNYHVVVPLWKGKTAEETRRAYRRGWKSPFGSPIRLFTDGGSEFGGVFQEGLFLDGTADERSAAYSPWQNSLIERHGQTWKSMFHKVCNTVIPSNMDEIEEVFEQVNVAKNTLVHKSGYSPNQRVFGKDPRLPGFVYGGGEDVNVVVNSGYLAGDPSYVKSMEIRHAARKAFIEHDHEDRVRRAIEHRTRPERGPFIPGCKVYVWRPGNAKPSGDRSYYWKGPGTVIGNSDSSKYWVSFGSKVLKCSPEQLRRLTDSDEAAAKLVPKELTEWRQLTSKRGVATFHDISKDPHPVEMFQNADEDDYWEVNGLRMRRVHVKKRRLLYVPSMTDNPPFDLELLGNQRKTTIHRVADIDLTVFDDWRRDGDGDDRGHEWTGYTDFSVRRTASMIQEDEDGTTRVVRPRLQDEMVDSDDYEPSTVELDQDEPGAERSTPDGADVDIFDDEELGTSLPEDSEPMTSVPQQQQGSTAVDSSYGPVRVTPLTRALRQDPGYLDAGRPYPRQTASKETLQAELASGSWLKTKHKDWKIDWENEVLIKRHEWRKTKYTPQREECPIPLEWLKGRRQTLMRDHRQGDGFKIIIDEDFRQCENPGAEKMGYWWSGYTVLDFQNPLDIETEEDVAEVNEVTLDEATKRQPDEWIGKKTEMEKLLKYQAARIIYPQEASTVRKSSCRILPSRFVITRKPDEKNPGGYVTKARWCIRGYLDPDVNQLKTQAPTLSQEALALVLQLSASHNWDINIGDIEGAFLQGDKLHRENGDLYVELPPGGAPGIPHGSLLKVEKAIYGLIDAPREWYDKLRRSLESIGFRKSKLDSCLYYAWDKGELIGSLAIHVDDLIVTGNQQFQKDYVDVLRKMFPFKHWKTNSGDFLGRFVKKNEDGSITVSQEEYCEKLKTIELTRERRRQKEASLVEKEKSQLRGVAGALNWLTGASRPDLASLTASVQQSIAHGTVADIARANHAVAEARDHRKTTVTVHPIHLHSLKLLVTADASWGTEPDLKRQGAHMVCATTTDIEDGGACVVSPLKWKSQKQERAVSSTLAAELLTVSKGVAEATWMRQFFLEARNEDFTLEGGANKQIPIIAVTDNKPLYDHINGDHGICQDKRLAIEVLILRRDVQQFGVKLRWVDTKQMLVDCMTKTSVKPTLMRHVLKTGQYAIMEEQGMLEAKKMHRQHKHTNKT